MENAFYSDLDVSVFKSLNANSSTISAKKPSTISKSISSLHLSLSRSNHVLLRAERDDRVDALL